MWRYVGSIAFLTLVGCSGGSGEQVTGVISPASGASGERAVANDSVLAALNAKRAQCGGQVALPPVEYLDPLATAAIKHAGWQALYDASHRTASLHHDEPQRNALTVSSDPGDRIRAANGGLSLPGETGWAEDTASGSTLGAVTQFWNSIYHRLPMMRHRYKSAGYGDMAIARTEYPAAGVPDDDPFGNIPDGNGYGTIDWIMYPIPLITLSYWPSQGTTGVPRQFNSNTEWPRPFGDPGPVVGPPIHVILPTIADVTSVSVTLTGGGTAHPVYILVGGASAPRGSGDASAQRTRVDLELAPGEIFVTPISPLTRNTTYCYSISAVAGGSTYDIGRPDPISFTTAP